MKPSMSSSFVVPTDEFEILEQENENNDPDVFLVQFCLLCSSPTVSKGTVVFNH